MHTTEIDGITIHHNGDYSGDVHIMVPTDRMQNDNPTLNAIELVDDPTTPCYEIAIPFDILRSIVVDYLRGKTISTFENMGDEEFVRFLTFTENY